MAFHKQSDFAAICGISPAQLAVDTKRFKVVRTETGLYDDTEVINQNYRIRCAENAEKRKQKGKEAPIGKREGKAGIVPKAPANKPPKKETTAKPPDPEMEARIREDLSVDVDLKKNRSRQLTAVASLAEMKEQRLRGEWILTADVEALFGQTLQSLMKSFQFTLDAFVTDIAARYKLNRNQQAEFRKRIIIDVNSSFDRAQAEVDNSIESLVGDAKNKKAA